MSDKLQNHSFNRVQSYNIFCNYANFWLSLQKIWIENKNYTKFTQKF